MKKTYIILIVLLAILGISAYLVLQKQGEQSIAAGSGEKFVLLDSLNVDKIEVKSSASSFLFEKQGGIWQIKEPIQYKADNSGITELIKTMKNLEVKSIVSSNPSKQSVFNVDSSSTHVKIYEMGNQKASFFVGKSGPSYSDTYVRKDGSNDVLLVNASLSYSFTKPVKDWRDKTIISVPQSNITEVIYQFGDTTFSLKKNNEAWLIGKDSTQESTVSSLLTSLSDVKADDFLDTMNVATKKIQAQISYANNQIRFAFDKTANKYYVQSSGSPQWFVVEQWKANQLLKRKKDLIKK